MLQLESLCCVTKYLVCHNKDPRQPNKEINIFVKELLNTEDSDVSQVRP